MSDLGPEAVERELQIRTRFDVPHVNANEVALLLIVRNLLANAIRYTPNGGCIEVGTSAREGMVTLSIDDSGPGIPVEQRLRAFQRFDRLGRTEPQGVGLGLSIVQALALNQRAVVDLLDSPSEACASRFALIGSCEDPTKPSRRTRRTRLAARDLDEVFEEAGSGAAASRAS